MGRAWPERSTVPPARGRRPSGGEHRQRHKTDGAERRRRARRDGPRAAGGG